MSETDLTPRAPRVRRRRGALPIVAVLLVLLAIGALLFKTLGDASLFFKNVDEAVTERDDLGTKRFRMQGTVVPGTIVNGEVAGRGAVMFTVSFNSVFADVASFDSPTELFKDGIPVVLEGQWVPRAEADLVGADCDGAPTEAFLGGAEDGFYFETDRILVKHDASYEADNSERITEAEYGGAARGATGAVSCGLAGKAS